MRLKNKISGEIKEFVLFDGKNELQGGATLKDLVKEWEDAPEEPTEYWYIDPMVCGIYCTKIKKDGDLYGFNKQIGNYFETKEEAEEAVEKLKAWKRLKDKGFRFTAWKNGILLDETIAGQVRYEFPMDNKDDIEKDLDLLFGGEE